jgi:hypothetical protein
MAGLDQVKPGHDAFAAAPSLSQEATFSAKYPAEPTSLDDHLDELLTGRAVQFLRCQLAILIRIGGIEAAAGRL